MLCLLLECKSAIPNSSITFQEKFPTQVLIRCSEGFAKFKLTSRACEHAKKSETLKSSCQASYQAAFSLWPPFYYHDPQLISIGKILLQEEEEASTPFFIPIGFCCFYSNIT